MSSHKLPLWSVRGGDGETAMPADAMRYVLTLHEIAHLGDWGREQIDPLIVEDLIFRAHALGAPIEALAQYIHMAEAMVRDTIAVRAARR